MRFDLPIGDRQSIDGTESADLLDRAELRMFSACRRMRDGLEPRQPGAQAEPQQCSLQCVCS